MITLVFVISIGFATPISDHDLIRDAVAAFKGPIKTPIQNLAYFSALSRQT